MPAADRRGRAARAAARWLFTERVATHGAHVIEQDVELASAVAGDELSPVQRPGCPWTLAAEAWADEFLPPSAPMPVVLINPGAGWGAKRWPVERYAAVAQGLIDRGMRVLVNAGPGEEPLAEGHRPREPAARQLLSPAAGATHRPHSPHYPGHCRRHRPAPPGLRPGPPGGGHLRPHRSQPQRPLRDPIQSAAQPGEPPRPHPPRSARRPGC